jgi:D-alanyl-D-alanine carboxypeptidase
MNEKAKSLGLSKTSFNDVTGLSKYNVSTASEVAKFAEAAISRPEINSILTMKKYELNASRSRKKIILNTDKLLDIFPRNNISLVGGKTGFTLEAGYCFVGKFKDNTGKEIVSVVLDTDDLRARFSDTKTIIDWAFGLK